jgi:hypothetical protein
MASEWSKFDPNQIHFIANALFSCRTWSERSNPRLPESTSPHKMSFPTVHLPAPKARPPRTRNLSCPAVMPKPPILLLHPPNKKATPFSPAPRENLASHRPLFPAFKVLSTFLRAPKQSVSTSPVTRQPLKSSRLHNLHYSPPPPPPNFVCSPPSNN